MKFALILSLFLFISGCASFGKGIAQAFLEKQEKEDTRLCHVYGKSFGGIEPDFAKSQGKTKLLKIHGVGHKVPGHSTEFLEKLAKELNLTVMNRKYKELSLTDPFDQSKKLGNLRVHRLTNEDETRELLFYELTWSDITAEIKSELNYDNSGEHSFRRAKINDLLKKFSNDTGPDPMIYLGDRHDDMLTSFRQSFCWMMRDNWDDLPERSNQFCNPMTERTVRNLSADSYSVVSHSLGSRITIDAFHSFVDMFEDDQRTHTLGHPELKSSLIKAFQQQEIPLYMLSNQLPMLQMGRKPPEVVEKKQAYCSPQGDHYHERILSKTSIIAFSDPNDLLSYTIPDKFVEKKLDSRFCFQTTNVIINIAGVFDLFGMGSVANLLTAHTDYDRDDRVVALIARGIGNPKTSPLVQERCEWTRLVD